MNPVGEVLAVDDIALDLDLSSKEALLRRVADMLARQSGLSAGEILVSLQAREELGSTALGHGVAIPHARMPQCGAAGGVLVRTRYGIPFDAPDGKPVSVFLGLIVPKQANERHLKLLATAAAMFSDRAFREKLRTSSDPSAVSDLLDAWPDSSAAQLREQPAQ
jgi:PTS system nitrogen regulatory IIA component